jgi:hypothetical protein
MSPDIEGFTLAEPIVAYRTWYIKPMIVPLFQEEDDCEDYGEYPLALYPMSNKTAWQKGVNEAECKTTTSAKNIYHESHQSPHPQCLCGLHANFAYKNKDQITGWSIFAGSMIIDGAVLMWGDMYAGESVIRAQYAEPLALIADDGEGKTLAEDYGIPACKNEKELAYVATENYSTMPTDVYNSLVRITRAQSETIRKLLDPEA